MAHSRCSWFSRLQFRGAIVDMAVRGRPCRGWLFTGTGSRARQTEFPSGRDNRDGRERLVVSWLSFMVLLLADSRRRCGGGRVGGVRGSRLAFVRADFCGAGSSRAGQATLLLRGVPVPSKSAWTSWGCRSYSSRLRLRGAVVDTDIRAWVAFVGTGVRDRANNFARRERGVS